MSTANDLVDNAAICVVESAAIIALVRAAISDVCNAATCATVNAATCAAVILEMIEAIRYSVYSGANADQINLIV